MVMSQPGGSHASPHCCAAMKGFRECWELLFLTFKKCFYSPELWVSPRGCTIPMSEKKESFMCHRNFPKGESQWGLPHGSLHTSLAPNLRVQVAMLSVFTGPCVTDLCERSENLKGLCRCQVRQLEVEQRAGKPSANTKM